MTLPRVLLVEDDASIRRLVELSLDGMPIELITCASVAAARLQLARGAVQLLITDLMMPGESGIDLLQSLARDVTLRADARVVVFSAGITPQARRTLEGLDVWRFLPKPASMDALEGCVIDALGLSWPADNADPVVPSEGACEPAGSPHDDAIARHFAGDAALFHAFRASCLTQFADDLAEGERAVTAGDAPSLRRLAHSLKSVLRTLGHDAAADDAAQLEAAAAASDWPSAAAPWSALSATLLRLSHHTSPGS